VKRFFIDYIEKAMTQGESSFYWLSDSPAHMVFFYNNREGKQACLHAHGQTKDDAVLELNELLGKYYHG
jgi:hypothetical protein